MCQRGKRPLTEPGGGGKEHNWQESGTPPTKQERSRADIAVRPEGSPESKIQQIISMGMPFKCWDTNTLTHIITKRQKTEGHKWLTNLPYHYNYHEDAIEDARNRQDL